MQKKIYVVADMEGISGIFSWKETKSGNRDYDAACDRLLGEVNAMVEGAYEGGATEVYVQDSHPPRRNLPFDGVDPRAIQIRGMYPQCLSLPSLDETFSGIMFAGFHGGVVSETSTLGHVLDAGNIASLRINGQDVGEVTLMLYLAAAKGVPTVFVSGEKEAVDEALSLDNGILAVVTKMGLGARSAVCYSAPLVCGQIRKKAAEAARNCETFKACLPPEEVVLEIELRSVIAAQTVELLPDLISREGTTITYSCNDYRKAYDMIYVILALADLGVFLGDW